MLMARPTPITRTIGLDDLSNAGGPGNWEGLAIDTAIPTFRGLTIHFPAILFPPRRWSTGTAANDPTRYVDASKIRTSFCLAGWPGNWARGLEISRSF